MDKLFTSPYPFKHDTKTMPFIPSNLPPDSTEPIPYINIPIELPGKVATKPITPLWIRDIETKLETMSDADTIKKTLNPGNGFPCIKMPFVAFKQDYSFEVFCNKERLFNVVLQLVDFNGAQEVDILELIAQMEGNKEAIGQKFMAMVKDKLDGVANQTTNKTHIFRMHTITGSAIEADAQITAQTGLWSILDVLTAATECTLTPLKIATLNQLLGNVTFGSLLDIMYEKKLSCGEFLKSYMDLNLHLMDREEIFQLAVYVSQCATQDYVSMAKMIATEIGHPIEFDVFVHLRHFYDTPNQMKLMWHLVDVKTVSLTKIIQLCKEHKQFPQNYLVQSLNRRLQGLPEKEEEEEKEEQKNDIAIRAKEAVLKWQATMSQAEKVVQDIKNTPTLQDVIAKFPTCRQLKTELHYPDGIDRNRVMAVILEDGTSIYEGDVDAIRKALAWTEPKPKLVCLPNIQRSIMKVEQKRKYDVEIPLPPPQVEIVPIEKKEERTLARKWTLDDVISCNPGCVCMTPAVLSFTGPVPPSSVQVNGKTIHAGDQAAIDEAVKVGLDRNFSGKEPGIVSDYVPTLADYRMFVDEVARVDAVKKATKQPPKTRACQAAPKC
jgi:hypothetical protein